MERPVNRLELQTYLFRYPTIKRILTRTGNSKRSLYFIRRGDLVDLFNYNVCLSFFKYHRKSPQPLIFVIVVTASTWSRGLWGCFEQSQTMGYNPDILAKISRVRSIITKARYLKVFSIHWTSWEGRWLVFTFLLKPFPQKKRQGWSLWTQGRRDMLWHKTKILIVSHKQSSLK